MPGNMKNRNVAVEEDLSRAHRLSANGNLSGAKEIYERILAAHPDSFGAQNGLWELRRMQIKSHDFHSQSGQDEFLFNNVFKNKVGGFFLDIGAYDGVTGSNTWFFEKTMHWRGICIEPSPQQFDRMVMRRQCICYNICISDFEGETKFFDIKEGLTMMGGMLGDYNPDIYKHIISDPNSRGQVIQSKVARLSSILDAEGVTNIDYCSIDVEGAEMNILSDIDYEKYNIYIFSVENNCDNLEIRRFLVSKGYEFVTAISADEIYRKVNHVECD
jgi:FkbM family methyltransferase